ncbi:MAG: phage tail protein [Geobacter sp.]|nr:phage tail protein [Geobacter sp.]
MFLLLGDIGLAKLTSPTAMDLKRSYSYPEHQVAEGQPLLQWTGTGLDEFSVSLLIHASFAPPQKAWDSLIRLADKHAAVPVCQGNGLFLGWFVIPELSRTSSVCADDGTLISIEIKLTLKQYADPKPLETKKVQKPKPAVKKPGKKIPAKKADVPQLTTASRKAGYEIKTVDGKRVAVRQGKNKA